MLRSLALGHSGRRIGRVAAVLILACCHIVGPFEVAGQSASSAACAPRTPQSVIGVAHNSGNSAQSITKALSDGADLIELDLREQDGRLISSHFPPVSVATISFTFGLDARETLEPGRTARGLLLDLKQSDESFLALVAQFIGEVPNSQVLYVSSPDATSMNTLADSGPRVLSLLTIRNREEFVQFAVQTTIPEWLDGVSIRHELLDTETLGWLCTKDLAVFAWPVEDPTDARNLVAAGVTGLTTGNPEILRLLADPD